QLLDQYNSDPDYFEAASPAEKRRVRGRADVFLRYCQPHVTVDQVEAVLRADPTFADETVSQLAEFLGIDPEHALTDYRDGDGPGGGDFDDDDADDDDSGPRILRPRGDGPVEAVRQQLAAIMGHVKGLTSAEGDALVKAAAAGDVAQIERL